MKIIKLNEIQFNEINPQFNVLVTNKTNISSTLRTVSGTSAAGSEVSFNDLGFESISLNTNNILNSPRIVCSRVNESSKLSSLPKSKSLTLGVRMETANSNVSPIIDLTEASTFVFGRNRLNKPVFDFAKDSTVNKVEGDPHSSVYISKRIDLAQPATSLKVLFSAYRHSTSDFRVLYKLFKSDSSEVNSSYELFPGYNNIDDSIKIGRTVIDKSLNDGSSDVFVRASNENEFLDYQYTADDVDLFDGFIIKIVMNGTNEAFTPKFKDLRVIALA